MLYAEGLDSLSKPRLSGEGTSMVPQVLCVIDRETEHRVIEAVASHAGGEWVAQLHIYAPQLVQLMFEAQDRPMRQFTSRIRRLVLEYEHCDDGGDACGWDDQALDEHVQVLVEALEQVRRDRLARDGWSHMPAALPMFG